MPWYWTTAECSVPCKQPTAHGAAMQTRAYLDAVGRQSSCKAANLS